MSPAPLEPLVGLHPDVDEQIALQAAAQAVGCAPDQIVKTLLFLVDGEPVLAIACGTKPIEQRSIAAYFQIGRKRVKLADAARVLQHTGYPVGALPPIGHASPTQTLIDPEVLTWDWIYAGGGAADHLLKIRPADLIRLSQGIPWPLRLESPHAA